MKLNDSFIPVLVEIFKVKKGMASFKLSLSDTHKVRAQLAEVPIESMLKFLYLVSAQPKLSRTGLISAFLQAHVDARALVEPPPKTEVLQMEMQQKLEAPKPDAPATSRPAAPTLSELLNRGVVMTS